MIKDQPAGSGSKRRLSIPVMAAFGAGELVQAVVTIGCTRCCCSTINKLLVCRTHRAGARHRPVFRRCNRSRSRQPVGSNPGATVVASRYGWGSNTACDCFLFSVLPPDGLAEFGNFVWLTVFAILVRTALTFFVIPHLALGAEMAPIICSARRCTRLAVNRRHRRSVDRVRGMGVLSDDR